MLPDIDRLLVPDADASRLKGESLTALDKIPSAISTARGKEPAQLVAVLISSAEQLLLSGNFEQASEYADEASRMNTGTKERLRALILVGTAMSFLGKLDDSENALLEAVKLARGSSDIAGLADALFSLAHCVLLVRGKFWLAISYLEEAQILYNQTGRDHWGWHLVSSQIHIIMGERQQAHQILYETVKDIEPATPVAGAYYYLWACLTNDEGEFDRAKEYLRLGLRIAIQTGMPDLILGLRLEHSRYYRLIGKPSIAREWVEDALKQAKFHKLIYSEALAYRELAQSSWQTGHIKLAEEELASALEILNRLKADYDRAYTFYLRALWSLHTRSPIAEQAWIEAATAIIDGGYAFILEKDQESAIPLTAAWLHGDSPEGRKMAEQLLEHLAQVPPQAIRVSTLGQFTVWKGKKLIPEKAWLRRRAGELFRYLLLQPKRTAGKDAILEALWPDSIVDSNNDILHQATSALRRLLEPELPGKFPSRYLIYEGDQISLRLPPGSVVDFEVFRMNLQAAIQSCRTDQIQEVLQLYGGELFPQDQFSDWSTELRTHLAELDQQGLLALAKGHLEQERYADALESVRQVLKLDPWNEEAVLIGMKTHIQLDSSPNALRLYNQLRESLLKELGIPPRQDLRELAETILHR
jgi:DNA-binding SARP family transcriptional activator